MQERGEEFPEGLSPTYWGRSDDLSSMLRRWSASIRPQRRHESCESVANWRGRRFGGPWWGFKVVDVAAGDEEQEECHLTSKQKNQVRERKEERQEVGILWAL
jgi:hypothetical protein